MRKKVVPKFGQEVKVKVDIVTSDDIKIYYTKKFRDFPLKYIMKKHYFVIDQFFSCQRTIVNLPYDSFGCKKLKVKCVKQQRAFKTNR